MTVVQPKEDRTFSYSINRKRSVDINVKVGAIIFDETHDHLLLIHGRLAKKWNVPKGSSEFNESKRETALRELYEETGHKFHISKYDVPIKFGQVYLYVLTVPKNTKFDPIDKYEIKDIKWFHVNEIEAIENKTKLLKRVFRHIMYHQL